MTKYWFRPKRFGYGATPNSWQGWLVLAVFVAGMVGMTFVARQVPHGERALVHAGGVVVMFALLLLVVRARTDGPLRWRNGEDS